MLNVVTTWCKSSAHLYADTCHGRAAAQTAAAAAAAAHTSATITRTSPQQSLHSSNGAAAAAAANSNCTCSSKQTSWHHSQSSVERRQQQQQQQTICASILYAPDLVLKVVIFINSCCFNLQLQQQCSVGWLRKQIADRLGAHTTADMVSISNR